MSDLAAGVFIAGVFSLVVASIEVPRAAKADFWPSLSGAFLLYACVQLIGHAASTMLASTIVGDEFPGPKLFWYPFLGVFGFQAVFKNVNVTFFEKGVLTIEEWVAKARDLAVAAAIRKQAVADKLRAINIADRLQKHPDLNTYVTQFLGPGTVQTLERVAQQEGANPVLIKALALAFQKPDEAAALSRKSPP